MSQKMFDNDLVVIWESKVTLNKPLYVGMCILDLSLSINVPFPLWLHWNKYGNNSRLLFTDTDSLMYEIKVEDVYEDFSKDK